MQLLEQNEIEKLVGLGCDPIFDLAAACKNLFPCHAEHYCQHLCTPIKCNMLSNCGSIAQCGHQLIDRLTDGLTACGEGFYVKCPGFDRIEQYWPDFDPAVKAAKLKEQMLLDRISKLEAKVERLEPKK